MSGGARTGRYAVGIDLGGTRLKLVAVGEGGRELARTGAPTDDPRSGWLGGVREQVAGIEAAVGAPADWIGVAAPGLVARDGRSVAWMQGRLDAVQGLDWTEHLRARRPVPVVNDAHAALLGEAWCGAAAGRRDVVLLTLGTGVGGAALVDGRLLTGHIGRAGHLGHVTLDADAPPDIVGTPGSLEDAIGDCTVAARSGGRFASTQALVAAARAGDAEASAVWLRSVQRLACGIASLVNVLDPEIVVLGGGIARAGADLFDPLGRYLDRLEWRPLGTGVPVVPATLGEYAGALGAARHAFTAADP